MATRSEIKRQHPDWDVTERAPMDCMINCASCGKIIGFFQSYPSHEQTDDTSAFSLAICGDCYSKEISLQRGDWNGRN